MMGNPFAEESKPTSAWLWQVFTGVGLVILLGLHFIANHFVAKGGLRDFAEVVAYLRNPVVLGLEVLFLLCVTTHALLGVRAILLDFGLSEPTERRLDQILKVVGVLTVGYGLVVTWAVIR
jgi:succinate dehydrogenase hydrophobic anchor subunit